MLTGRTDEADRVAGLEVGADDYMVKPFSLRELVARVRALLRRWDRQGASEAVAPTEMDKGTPIQFGDLIIEQRERRVTVDGREVKLSGMEFRLLHLLAAHPNKTFTREELLDKVWGQSRHVALRSVDTYFWRLREKVEVNPEKPVHLMTVRGAGYMFSTTQSEERKVLPIRAKSSSA